MDKPLRTPLENIVHDVNSKCGALREAAQLLSRLPADRADELLQMMTDQAQSLTSAIAEYRHSGAQKPSH